MTIVNIYLVKLKNWTDEYDHRGAEKTKKNKGIHLHSARSERRRFLRKQEGNFSLGAMKNLAMKFDGIQL